MKKLSHASAACTDLRCLHHGFSHASRRALIAAIGCPETERRGFFGFLAKPLLQIVTDSGGRTLRHLGLLAKPFSQPNQAGIQEAAGHDVWGRGCQAHIPRTSLQQACCRPPWDRRPKACEVDSERAFLISPLQAAQEDQKLCIHCQPLFARHLDTQAGLTLRHTFLKDSVARLESRRWQARERLGSSFETELHVAGGRVFGRHLHEALELCASDMELSGVESLWACPLIAFAWYRANKRGCVPCKKVSQKQSLCLASQPALTSGKVSRRCT